MWTPIYKFPFGNLKQCNASSISLQPGGSMLTTFKFLKSKRLSSYSGGILKLSPSVGKH